MAKGGARVGAGRKAGSTDKAMRKVSIERILASTGTGIDKLPVPFLLAIMNSDQKDIKLSERIQCAIAAAPYCHARLASVEVKTETKSTMQAQSDLASALRELAEIARLRSNGDVIDGVVMEAGTMEEPDKMSARPDKMSALVEIEGPDKMSTIPDKMSSHTEGGDGDEMVVVGDDEMEGA